MFPSSQSALPLPPRPSLERYRKLAKELVKACKSGDPGALHKWAERWIESLVSLSGLVITAQLPVRISSWIEGVESFALRQLLTAAPDRPCSLTGAQYVVARAHGFESWLRFATHLKGLESATSPASRFELAAEAIVQGDLAGLKRLLRDEPELIRARSARKHGATLLHYVSANGVEGYRQRTPPNIAEIARHLLGEGAEVDAFAHVYGGECTTLLLTATSGHPERAGVQPALLATLLDGGARLELPTYDHRSLVADCLANGRLIAAEYLAVRGAPVALREIAVVGKLDDVKAFLTHPNAGSEIQQAFLNACAFGRTEIAQFLLELEGEQAVDLAGSRAHGQTGLHLAVIGGHLDTLKVLLAHQPPLEARNAYDGTAFGQAIWSAAHGGDPSVFLAILQALQTAGATIPSRHVRVNPTIDQWLEEQGCHAEPTWSWEGE